MSDQTITRSELLRQMRAGRAELEQLIADLTDSQCESRPEPDLWSIKDVLAHVSAWDRHLLAWIDGAESGVDPPMPAPSGFDSNGVNRFNLQNFETSREASLGSVVSESLASFEALMRRAETLPDRWLLEAGVFPWAGGHPLWFYFAADSYWHYREHLDQLRSLVALVRSGSNELSPKAD